MVNSCWLLFSTIVVNNKKQILFLKGVLLSWDSKHIPISLIFQRQKKNLNSIGWKNISRTYLVFEVCIVMNMISIVQSIASKYSQIVKVCPLFTDFIFLFLTNSTLTWESRLNSVGRSRIGFVLTHIFWLNLLIKIILDQNILDQ